MASNTESVLTDDHGDLDLLLEETCHALESSDIATSFHMLDFFWARLAMHIRAEHLRLFPVVLAMTKSNDSSDLPENIPVIIERLHGDHDFFMQELARAIKAMRLVGYFGNEAETRPIVRELLIGVKNRLVEHNRIEEEVVYPLARGLLIGDKAAEQLREAVQKEINKLPPRFISAKNDR